jgi:hypothetical protein
MGSTMSVNVGQYRSSYAPRLSQDFAHRVSRGFAGPFEFLLESQRHFWRWH